MTINTEVDRAYERVTVTDDAVEIRRPEGVSQSRWERMQAELALIATGHAPWCQTHEEDSDYCNATWSGACVNVMVSNGTIDGSTALLLEPTNGADLDALTIGEAACIGQVLLEAAELARRGTLGRLG